MATACNNVNNTKAMRTKNLLRHLRYMCIHCKSFSSADVAVQELSGGSLNPPLVSRCGSKTPRVGEGYNSSKKLCHVSLHCRSSQTENACVAASKCIKVTPTS